MKVVKGFVAFALAVILAASAALALGSYAVTEAISEESVEKAIRETDAVGQLTDSIIQDNTVNLGGRYGEIMQTVLKSDAMTDFFTVYTARCLQSQIYGEEMEEVGADDLNMAFSRGMDECIEDGSIDMGEGERKLFDIALNLAMPNLTEGVNFVLQQMDLTDFVDEESAKQIEMAKAITSDPVRYGAAGIAIMACLLLLVIYWRSKLGLLLAGIVVLIIAAMMLLASVYVDSGMGEGGGEVVLSRQMLFIMASYGLRQAMTVGGICGGALVVACPVFKLLFRHRP